MNRYLLKKIIKLCNVIALLMVIQSANSTCTFYINQPKYPEKAKKYRV